MQRKMLFVSKKWKKTQKEEVCERMTFTGGQVSGFPVNPARNWLKYGSVKFFVLRYSRVCAVACCVRHSEAGPALPCGHNWDISFPFNFPSYISYFLLNLCLYVSCYTTKLVPDLLTVFSASTFIWMSCSLSLPKCCLLFGFVKQQNSVPCR